METVDIKQQELDFVEQQILTDIFGGYNPDKFVFRYGFFKLDLTTRVQKAILDFEKLVKPLMDDNGLIEASKLRSIFNENLITIPDGNYRLISLYRKVQPFLSTFLSYLGGL